MRCPVCASLVSLAGTSPVVLGCAQGHRFDVARQGHVVLVAGGSKLRADTADMVAARERVLASGVYDPVRDALVTAAGGAPGGLLLDCGAGTGAYTAAVLESFAGQSLAGHDASPGRGDAAPGPEDPAATGAGGDRLGVALELSVPALRRAARAHPRLAAVGADLTRPLPLASSSVALVTAVFAPLPTDPELRRVALPGARLVVVTPTPAHLAALRDRLGLLDVPAGKAERLIERLAPTWVPADRVDVEAPVTFDPAMAGDVVAMGPNAWHDDGTRSAALTGLPDAFPDTLAVTVTTLVRSPA